MKLCIDPIMFLPSKSYGKHKYRTVNLTHYAVECQGFIQMQLYIPDTAEL